MFYPNYVAEVYTMCLRSVYKNIFLPCNMSSEHPPDSSAVCPGNAGSIKRLNACSLWMDCIMSTIVLYRNSSQSTRTVTKMKLLLLCVIYCYKIKIIK